MADQLVTVFGGTGFLGRTIARRLTNAGYQVRAAARHPEAHDDGRIEFLTSDIRERADVARALDGAGAAVNAVSLYAETRALSFDDIHVEGAARVAAVARAAGCRRLVHVSGLAITEHSPSPYVRARARGETRVREAFPQATIVRPSVIFGPDDAFLSALRRVTLAPVVPLFGSGHTRLQPVHVEDVAGAVVKILQTAQAAGLTYELGGPEVLTYREILETVLAHLVRRRALLPVPFPAWHLLAGMASYLPRPPLTRDQVRLLETDNKVADGALSFVDLDFEPRTLESALGECLSV